MLRMVRGVILAIVIVLTLLSGSASVAYANPGGDALFADAASASADPGDPGFPPDW